MTWLEFAAHAVEAFAITVLSVHVGILIRRCDTLSQRLDLLAQERGVEKGS